MGEGSLKKITFEIFPNLASPWHLSKLTNSPRGNVYKASDWNLFIYHDKMQFYKIFDKNFNKKVMASIQAIISAFFFLSYDVQNTLFFFYFSSE